MSLMPEGTMVEMTPPPKASAPALGGLPAFVAIGAGGALALVVLSSLMIWLNPHIDAWIVNTACYAALILPVYLAHRRFSFGSDAPHRQALPRYMAVQGMALVLAALFSFVAHGVLAMPTLVASTLVVVMTSGVNFVVLRSWAFARRTRAVTVAA